MSLFVDTGVFYAHHDTDAERHTDAVAVFDEICKSRGFDAVCSFDSDFDGLVDRIEPQA